MSSLTSIDLFCGCGGFSLGLKQEGFRTVAAIDSDPKAIEVFRANFGDVPHVLEEDLTEFGPADLEKVIGPQWIDVIVGGPPCQGFSHVRQRDGSNHGPRLIDDPRRWLYRQFLEYVGHFRPKLFVMENVLGMRTAEGGRYFVAVQSEARALDYRVHGIVIRAADFGVPQKRQRQLIVGTRLDIPAYFHESLLVKTHKKKFTTTGEAIGDLPIVRAGGGNEVRDYDLKRRAKYLAKYDGWYLRKVLEIDKAERLTAHRARPHNDRDLRDFKRLLEGEHAREAILRGEELEFPYDRSCFHDRYTRQHRDRLCSTIVAHLAKDGLMFIHPTQTRSLTPREAARIQSFPDWFQFPVARTHQYRMIGNAVPPLVARAVGKAIIRYLDETPSLNASSYPLSEEDAVRNVRKLRDLSLNSPLRTVDLETFLPGWSGIAYLFPQLHPDAYLDNKMETEKVEVHELNGSAHIADLVSPFYVMSGWPAELYPILQEARRRYKAKELGEEEFYCHGALYKGLMDRKLKHNWEGLPRYECRGQQGTAMAF